MITAHTIKVLQSLDKKKFRQKYNLFLVEGNKNIKELEKSSIIVKEIFSVDPSSVPLVGKEITKISKIELNKISFLKTPKESVALCFLPENKLTVEYDMQLVLDGIQDPGNLGTIIRLADWFGIEQIICSEDTVDLYNPKVVQATMGSFTRVNVVYCNLPNFLTHTQNQNIGTDMEGKSIYKYPITKGLNLILGNEGNGIRPETEMLLHDKIGIPRFGKHKNTESLNVSMAAGIILGQFFRENSE